MTVEIPESHRDLLDIPVAVLATAGPNGPHATAVWFLWDDGVVRTSGVSTRQWFKNGVRAGRASFLFVDPASPYRTLELRGAVTAEPDSDLAFMRREFEKYDTSVEAFGNPEPELRSVFTLTPDRAFAWGH